jgi:hypothetical protein
MTRQPADRPMAAILATLFLLVGLPGAAIGAQPAARTAAGEVSVAIYRRQVVRLPLAASHIAVHWRGQPKALVSVALSRDGRTFRAPIAVDVDEVGEQRGDGETYGSVIAADGARFARIRSDRPIAHVSVLALDTRVPAIAQFTHVARGAASPASASAPAPQPAVISRAGWGADESLRFDSAGAEKWIPAFYPVQKLIVHHTAGTNNDPDPAASVRAIYYYHAITQGWGDIGYNFLIDEAGRVYEGRYSRVYAPGETPTGQDASGKSVTAAHTYGFNSGTVGIALLGTLTNADAKVPARDALERMLAWEADGHAIDPRGNTLFTNPVNGTQKTFPNISGHRDLAATECPGGVFYATLPALRDAVAARMGTAPSPPPPPPPAKTVPGAPVLSGSSSRGNGNSLSWTLPADGGSAITGYRVYRATGSGSSGLVATVGASTRSWRDQNARRGTIYTYTVGALNAVGEGSRSNALKITTK